MQSENKQIEKAVAPMSNLELFNRYDKFSKSGYVVNEPHAKVEIALIALLKRVATLTAKDIAEDKIRMYVTELIKDIHSNYSWIKNDEIRFAFEQGAKGIFGPVYDISYTTLTNWIRLYRDSEERRTYIALINNKAAPDSKQIEAPTAKQSREDHFKEMYQIAWDIFETKMRSPDANKNPYFFLLLPEDAYNYLNNQKLIKYSIEEKQKVRTTVESILKSSDFLEKNSMFVPDFPSTTEKSDKTSSRERYIQSCCRKYCVAVFLNKLLQQKKDKK